MIFTTEDTEITEERLGFGERNGAGKSGKSFNAELRRAATKRPHRRVTQRESWVLDIGSWNNTGS